MFTLVEWAFGYSEQHKQHILCLRNYILMTMIYPIGSSMKNSLISYKETIMKEACKALYILYLE